MEQNVALAKDDGRGGIEDGKGTTENVPEPTPTALALCQAYHNTYFFATTLRKIQKPVFARQFHIDRQDDKPLIIGCFGSQSERKSLDIKAS